MKGNSKWVTCKNVTIRDEPWRRMCRLGVARVASRRECNLCMLGRKDLHLFVSGYAGPS